MWAKWHSSKGCARTQPFGQLYVQKSLKVTGKLSAVKIFEILSMDAMKFLVSMKLIENTCMVMINTPTNAKQQSDAQIIMQKNPKVQYRVPNELKLRVCGDTSWKGCERGDLFRSLIAVENQLFLSMDIRAFKHLYHLLEGRTEIHVNSQKIDILDTPNIPDAMCH